MPRTTIPLTSVPGGASRYAEVDYEAADQSNGMAFKNDGRTLLLVKNGDASAKKVKVTSVADPTSGRTGDLGDLSSTVSVGAGKTEVFNFLDPNLFNQRTGDYSGMILVDFDDDTSVEVAALKLSPS